MWTGERREQQRKGPGRNQAQPIAGDLAGPTDYTPRQVQAQTAEHDDGRAQPDRPEDRVLRLLVQPRQAIYASQVGRKREKTGRREAPVICKGRGTASASRTVGAMSRAATKS